jgi:hypothetical protein
MDGFESNHGARWVTDSTTTRTAGGLEFTAIGGGKDRGAKCPNC